jgi:pteridine reductase
MNQQPVILVTGAARRVGAEIVRTLHGAGAKVMIHYRRDHEAAVALQADLNGARPGSAAVIHAELGDAGAPAQLVGATVALFGRLDGLVNNASSFFPTPLETLDEAQWNDLIGSNLKAPLFLAREAAPHLRHRGGSIVNIVDIHAERPLRGYPVYSVAKAGLAGLTRALAIELAPQVRVNGVAPGPIAWPEDGQFDAAARAGIIAHTLLSREGTPADIARAVRFLMLEAPYVTGQILAVDGGRSAHL